MRWEAKEEKYLLFGLLLLLSIAGLVHGFKTPRTVAFAAPEPVPTRNGAKKVPAHV